MVPEQLEILVVPLPSQRVRDVSLMADSMKNPHAVALGKLGGLKGGPARAKKLSKKRRIEIAKLAAQARWNKKTAR